MPHESERELPRRRRPSRTALTQPRTARGDGCFAGEHVALKVKSLATERQSGGGRGARGQDHVVLQEPNVSHLDAVLLFGEGGV